MKGVMIVFMVAMGVALAAINGPNCGNRPYLPDNLVDDGKVVGGNQSVIGDHAWQIALLRNGNFICGGSIIDENTILCAAHCTTINTPSIYQVVRTSTRSPRESWAQTRNIRLVVSHPSYSSSTYKNDISLLFTTEPWVFDNQHFIPICLEDKTTPAGARAIATGWGSTQSGGSVVNVLREAYMPITTDANVQSQYGSSYDPVTMIGAANIGDGLDTCQGDSGGPLSTAYDNGNHLKKLKQVGIVSWGYGCGNIGIYSRVSTYISWIEQQIATHTGK